MYLFMSHRCQCFMSFPQNDLVLPAELCGSPCTAEPEAEVQPEQTSTADPGLLSERRSELASLLRSAGKRSASLLFCHTCGTTAANKLLCLKVHRKENPMGEQVQNQIRASLQQHNVNMQCNDAVA